MMITIAEQQTVPVEFLSNAVEYANLTAGWAFLTLIQHGCIPDKVSTKPAALLLELGALYHIAWLNQRADAAGLDLLGLPNYHDEVADLLARIENEPGSFATIEGAKLSRRMFKFQMNNVAWNVPTICKNEPPPLFLVKTDDENFLDLVAEFCWKNRRKFK